MDTVNDAVDMNAAMERYARLSTVVLVIQLSEAMTAKDIPEIIAASVELGRRIERDDLGGIRAAAAALDELDRPRRPDEDQRTRRTRPVAP